VVSWLDTALWGLTVAAFTSAAASVTHERALKTHEPSCVPRTAKHFFVYVVHSPSGVVGHVAAPELLFQEGRVPSRGTRGTPELTSVRRRGPELRDTWQRQNSPQQRGEVQGRGTRGAAGAHLCREV
jgi:hypothetical protein